jgi:hypothetical protein
MPNQAVINGFDINGTGVAPTPPSNPLCFDTYYNVGQLKDLNFDTYYNVLSLPKVELRRDAYWEFAEPVQEQFVFELGLMLQEAFPIDLELVTDSFLDITYTDTIEEAFALLYDLKFPLAEEFLIKYNIKDTDPVDAFLDIPMPLIVDSVLDIIYNLRPVIEEDFVYPSRLLVDADAPFTVLYNINDFETVDSSFTTLYSLLDETSIDVTGGIELEIVATGEIVPILEGSVQFDEGGYNWLGTVALANVGDESKFNFDDEVIIRIFGEEYNMVVDAKEVNRERPGQATAGLMLAGLSARFDVPRAPAYTNTFDTAITASAAVEAILGTTVDWQMIDWTIPAGRLGGEAVSPIELAQQVATAGGGIIETNRDGTLYVRNLFPVPVAQYPTTTPDDVLLEQDSIMSLAESFEGQELFNKFRIRDVSDTSFRDRIVFEADDNTGLSGSLFVYPAPFRPITVEHTSDTQISLTPVGEVFVEQEEIIEFQDGQGGAAFPIHDLLSVEWMDDDLGPLTFTQYENTFFTATGIGDPVGYSLATVTYRARAFKFNTSSTVDDSVQFIVVDC